MGICISQPLWADWCKDEDMKIVDAHQYTSPSVGVGMTFVVEDDAPPTDDKLYKDAYGEFPDPYRYTSP